MLHTKRVMFKQLSLYSISVFSVSSLNFIYRNVVYNLSIFDLTEQQKLIWYSPEDDVKMCVVKGKDEVSSFDRKVRFDAPRYDASYYVNFSFARQQRTAVGKTLPPSPFRNFHIFAIRMRVVQRAHKTQTARAMPAEHECACIPL